MSFGLVPASPFVDFVTKPTAATFNAWRVFFTMAVDGINGGPYNLAPGATLSFPAGGGNIVIDAPLAFSNAQVPLGGTFDLYGVLNVENLGVISVLSGGQIQIQNNGELIVENLGLIQVDNGGKITAVNGSTVELTGQTYIVDLGGGGSNGELLIGDSILGTGRLIVTAEGSVTFQSSSICTWGPGSEALFSGTGASCQFQTNAVLTMLASAGNATFQNQVDLEGITVQSGEFQKSGAGAVTVERPPHVLTLTNGTVTVTNPLQYDSIQVNNTGNSTIQLDSSPPGVAWVMLKIWMGAPGLSSGSVTVKDDFGFPLCVLNPSGVAFNSGTGTPCGASVEVISTLTALPTNGHYFIRSPVNAESP